MIQRKEVYELILRKHKERMENRIKGGKSTSMCVLEKKMKVGEYEEVVVRKFARIGEKYVS